MDMSLLQCRESEREEDEIRDKETFSLGSGAYCSCFFCRSECRDDDSLSK